MTLSQSELKAMMHYDPETGLFAWRINSGTRARIGEQPGCFSNGYRRLRWKGKGHLMHRLAFLYMTGEMPSLYVDHINGVRDDNRWCNLRLCEFEGNARNAKRRDDNSTGAKGVQRRASGRYRVRIWANGERVHIGDFTSIEAARAAYAEAAKQAHGEFARTA